VVNGNHDEGQRFQQTYPGDGWATEAAIITKERIEGHPALGHVEIVVPDKWKGHMTVPVGDSVVTIVHGHQFKQRTRAFTWWANQALNNRNPGGAHVLQHGHFHTFEIETNEVKTRIGSPTFDCGSPWFEDLTGASSKRGAAVYLLRAGEVSRVSVI
jgi:predicted phosphodiesterase